MDKCKGFSMTVSSSCKVSLKRPCFSGVLNSYRGIYGISYLQSLYFSKFGWNWAATEIRREISMHIIYDHSHVSLKKTGWKEFPCLRIPALHPCAIIAHKVIHFSRTDMNSEVFISGRWEVLQSQKGTGTQSHLWKINSLPKISSGRNNT